MSDEEREDGFRSRRTRTKAEMKQLIKDGVVRDPDAPPELDREYPDDVHVIRPPAMTVDGQGGE